MTSDPNAWPDTRRLLTWLSSLRVRPERNLVIGQQLESYGNPQYDRFVDAVTTKTGRTPAMVGIDVHSGWHDDNFPTLIKHWQRGGLITVDWHPGDPWRDGSYETAWVERGPGRYDDDGPKRDLRQLLAAARDSSQRSKWLAQRTQVGRILGRLASEGITVIFRPLHEQNGKWFWWGQDQTTKKTAVAELYRELWTYFVDELHLHNLLWSFSPAPSWDGHALQYYPGDTRVDLIAPTRYDDSLRLLGPEIRGEENHDDWKALSSKGKPIGYGEFAPSRSDGNWDARTVLRTTKTYYPSMVFAHCWHGWQENGRWVAKELASQRYVKELMTDPRVISLENIDWRHAPLTTTES